MGHPAFKLHKLNSEGIHAVLECADLFDGLLASLTLRISDPRCLSIVTTKLEEACLFAKKGIASSPNFQEGS